MPRSNTPLLYGSVTKTFHWLTALLILTAIPLGLIANRLPHETAAELALKAQLFSLHKTVGIAAFAVALLRILWALTQRKPAPLHPERRGETLLAEVVHWSLYGAMVVVPLSGWLHHAATSGFAPILWPFGQSLPLVAQSESLAAFFAAVHFVFTKVLILSILLHIAGAIKHALIDRDATLARMLPGTPALQRDATPHNHTRPAMIAGAIYAAGFALSVALAPPTPGQASGPALTESGGEWQVQAGSLSIRVQQFGSEVEGQFSRWSADIAFDENAPSPHGAVDVEIDINSLTLGSVTEQAMGPAYFDAETFPTATFRGDILSTDGAYRAEGTLTLKGAEVPVTLPFTLTLEGDRAEMRGQTTVDRLNFGIGADQTDEATLGFAVVIDVALTASR
ncbi:cytochrome b/b6 domain-containing protein [Oceaniglobus trochenteri]|uniref:cytochrome b/b6 domain-containing protein n=1 Tax=Oceaniglobus trochenteri TaxID=2763260 RepID=UPI001CFF7900|nr:cytochrome b/b6 domain-containing protein [Oceaniglobus trochenteri]